MLRPEARKRHSGHPEASVGKKAPRTPPHNAAYRFRAGRSRVGGPGRLSVRRGRGNVKGAGSAEMLGNQVDLLLQIPRQIIIAQQCESVNPNGPYPPLLLFGIGFLVEIIALAGHALDIRSSTSPTEG